MATPVPLSPSALDNPVQTIRRCNRFYTRPIGVLQEHLLQSRSQALAARCTGPSAGKQRGLQDDKGCAEKI